MRHRTITAMGAALVAAVVLVSCGGHDGTTPPDPESGEVAALRAENEALQARVAELEAARTSPDRVSVVVADYPIPAGTRLTPEMVTIIKVPATGTELLPVGAATSPDQVIGAVTRIPILSGEPIVAAKLTLGECLSGGKDLAWLVPAGRRAMAIDIGGLAAPNGLARPGDRVDVLAVLRVPARSAETAEILAPAGEPILLLQNLEVLAVGDVVLRALPCQPDRSASAGGSLPDQPSPSANASTLTLSVTNDEGLLLLRARELGTIQFTLRPPGDSSMTAIPTYDLTPRADS